MINMNPFWSATISYFGFSKSDVSEIEEENIIRALKTRKYLHSRCIWVHPDFCGFCGVRVAQSLVFRRDHDRIVLAFTTTCAISTKAASSNPVHGEVYSIQHYVIKVCQWLAGLLFSLGTPVWVQTFWPLHCQSCYLWLLITSWYHQIFLMILKFMHKDFKISIP